MPTPRLENYLINPTFPHPVKVVFSCLKEDFVFHLPEKTNLRRFVEKTISPFGCPRPGVPLIDVENLIEAIFYKIDENNYMEARQIVYFYSLSHGFTKKSVRQKDKSLLSDSKASRFEAE